MPNIYHTAPNIQADIYTRPDFKPLSPISPDLKKAAAAYGMVLSNLAICTQSHAEILAGFPLLENNACFLSGVAEEFRIEAHFSEFLPYCPEDRAGYLEHLKQDLAWRRGDDR